MNDKFKKFNLFKHNNFLYKVSITFKKLCKYIFRYIIKHKSNIKFNNSFIAILCEIYELLASKMRAFLSLLCNYVFAGRRRLRLASERRSLGLCIKNMFMCLCSLIKCLVL